LVQAVQAGHHKLLTVLLVLLVLLEVLLLLLADFSVRQRVMLLAAA
jgi:uncharacterized Rmd1/YagE family protein